MTKSYQGVRGPAGNTVTVTENGVQYHLRPRNNLRNHSPDGFEWGYGGSGPAQLALALAADVLGDDQEALEIYQELKFRFIANLHGDTWKITEEHLLKMIRYCQGTKMTDEHLLKGCTDPQIDPPGTAG